MSPRAPIVIEIDSDAEADGFDDDLDDGLDDGGEHPDDGGRPGPGAAARRRVVAPDPDDDEGPSKSAIKREYLALQALAEQLLTLPRAALAGLPLGERTWVAIEETARVKDRRAMRRHVKRVANCLARENTAPLTALIAAREAQQRAADATQHAAEQWRARLLAEGDAALAELVDAHPAADRQRLRQLVREARREQARDAAIARPEPARRLFRALRSLLGGAPAGGGDGADDAGETGADADQ